MVKRLIKILLYGDLDKKEYQSVQNALAEKNRKTLYMTAFVCMFLFICMFLSTYFSAQTDLMDYLRVRSRLIYALMIFICGFTVLIAKQQKPTFHRYVMSEWYLFLSMLFGFAIWAGTYNQPYYPSITFFVFLFALPLLIVDRPLRLSFYLIFVSFVFVLCSYRVKIVDLYELDFLNCLCFLYLSITLSGIMMIYKYNEALQKIEVEKQRDYDSLTGLLNKAAIEHQICQCLKAREKGFLMIIDIDDFKNINDCYGHLFGDAVLCAYAKCFLNVFSQSSLIGRFGGDEFVLFVKTDSFDDIVALFEKGQDVLKSMVKTTSYNDLVLTMSAGVVYYNGTHQDYLQLFEKADHALYEAKHNGKNQMIYSQS